MSSVGPGLVYVQIHAGDRRFSVITSNPARPIAVCDGDCAFWVWPGNYSVRLRLDGANKDSSLSLRIRRPGRYELIPANRSARNAGLALGVAGPVVAFVGLIMAYVGIMEGQCDDAAPQAACTSNGPEPVAYYGLATLAAGAGMTTVGWIMFAHNRVHFQHSEDPGPLETSARISVLPMPQGGLGLGATVAF